MLVNPDHTQPWLFIRIAGRKGAGNCAVWQTQEMTAGGQAQKAHQPGNLEQGLLGPSREM